jgi:hypothetical protein
MEDSCLLECNAVSLDKYFLTFHTGSNSPRRITMCIIWVWVEKDHCGRQANKGSSDLHWGGSLYNSWDGCMVKVKLNGRWL